MKVVDQALVNAIRNDYELQAAPKVIVEWNHNRYTTVTADNYVVAEVDNAFDPDLFPVESIVKPNRPNKSAAKLLVGEGNIFDNFHNSPIRYLLSSADDIYQYWVSQDATDGSGNFPLATDGITTTRPFITYSAPVATNYIVIKTQNSWASPNSHKVLIKTSSAGAWTTIATNPTIAPDGSIRLYYNGTSWSSNKTETDSNVNIVGIMYQVNSLGPGKDMDGATTTYTNSSDSALGATHATTGYNSHLHLIEISARLRSDISDYVISTSLTLDLGENSILYPLGTITSNVGTITLFNDTQIFTKSNTSGRFYGLIEENAKFEVSYVYTVDDETYEVPDGVLYANSWKNSDSATTVVDCDDYSKFFQDVSLPKMAFSNMSVSQIVSRLLDAVGFTGYDITLLSSDDIIPIYFTDGVKTVWEGFNELATASQSAIYFDAMGTLNIKTRDDAFSPTAGIDWTAYNQTTNGSPADIVTMDVSNEDAPNHITVNYKTTQWTTSNYGLPVQQKVWVPDSEVVVLRSAPLMRKLDTNDKYVRVSQDNARAWPFESSIQVNTEMIGLYGKEYLYYDGAVQKKTDVYSTTQQKQLDAKAYKSKRFRNTYTGNLRIGLNGNNNYNDARGMENSKIATHDIEPGPYSIRSRVAKQTVHGARGVVKVKVTKKKTTKNKHGDKRVKKVTRTVKKRVVSHINELPGWSQLRLSTNKNYKTRTDVLVATIGAVADSPMFHFGTKITFDKDKSRTQQEAGIVIASNTNESGYYIDLKEKHDKHRYSLAVYTRDNDKYKMISPNKGYDLTVLPGVPVEIDVDLTLLGSDNNHHFSISANGHTAIQFTVEDADKQYLTGRFGLFAAGNTSARFDYLYAIDNAEGKYIPDDFTFFDIEAGAFQGQKFQREWLNKWHWAKRRHKKKLTREYVRDNIYYYDEFGPMVHEIRDFDVTFDPMPVMYASLYLSNVKDAISTEFRASPFGAKFRLINTSRSNAILVGQDNATLAVIGRVLTIGESTSVTVQDDLSVSRRGVQDITLDSDWIQSKSMANEVANWMKTHWSQGLDTIDLQIFGNPLIELGDIFGIDSEIDSMSPSDDQYFVTNIQNSFESGLSTTLSLRRRVS